MPEPRPSFVAAGNSELNEAIHDGTGWFELDSCQMGERNLLFPLPTLVRASKPLRRIVTVRPVKNDRAGMAFNLEDLAHEETIVSAAPLSNEAEQRRNGAVDLRLSSTS